MIESKDLTFLLVYLFIPWEKSPSIRCKNRIMVEKTPNHGLNLYQIGDKNWSHSADMEALEKKLWIHDVEEKRNEYVAYKNAAFFATDTGDVYIGNEKEWLYIGTIDSTGSHGEGQGNVFETFHRANLDHYEGDTDVFDVISGNISGESVLKYEGTDDGDKVIASPEIDTERLMTYSAYVRPRNETFIAEGIVLNATIDDGDVVAGYLVVASANDRFRIFRKDEGDPDWRENELAEAIPGTAAGELYRFEVDLGVERIEARMVDTEDESVKATITTTDDTYESGYFGWYGNGYVDRFAEFDFAAQKPLESRETANGNGGGESVGTETLYAPGHTNWGEGLSDIEIYRIKVPNGETLTVDGLQFHEQGGGSSDSGASIDVYDASEQTVIDSADLNSTSLDGGESGEGATVLIRLSNSIGGSDGLDAMPVVWGSIE